ncbi:MAG: acyl-CoA dehydrogenase family protein [Deferribacterota bacterium]|nr:acyl-CoA dehydrogenase family protein [Deferribacterota bacterium]
MRKGGEFLIEEIKSNEVFTPEEFTDEQKQIAETTENFAINEVQPHLEELEHDVPNGKYDLMLKLFKRCAELGLLMIDVSEEYGGLDLDKATSMLVAEKMTLAGSFAVVHLDHIGIGTLPLIYYGTDEQKRKYLDKLMSGEWLGAYALTEPEAGTDVLGAKSTAVLSDDKKYYILNGTKQFITNAGAANLFTIFAKVDKEKYTAFLVERDTEGLSFGPEEKKMGMKASSTRQVIMDNVKVPVENLLGEIGKGHKIAFNILNIGRFKLGAGATGGMKYGLVESVKYANERKQFGRPISSFGAIKEKIADIYLLAYASESLVYRLAGLLDEKLKSIDKSLPNYYEEYQNGIEEYAPECSIAKVFCSDAQGEVVDHVVQILGGYGYIADYPAERYYRDERINRIWEGTNEVNRMLVPGMILRRALKGELPIMNKVKEAMDQMMSIPEEAYVGEEFGPEKDLLKNLKNLSLIVSGNAVQKFGENLKDEQEVLYALGDVIINLFALESTVLRSEKIYNSLSDEKKEFFKALTKITTYRLNDRIFNAAKKIIYYSSSGDEVHILLSALRKFTRYNVDNLLSLRRKVADTVIENERYL